MRIRPRESDTTQAYLSIRKSIIEGFFKPGERLVESRLSEQLGVSRTPVREALAMLEVEGLVKAVPKRGCLVRTYSEPEIEAMYDMRALLEGHAARKAALMISDGDIDRLETVWRDMEECINGERHSVTDQPKRVRYLADRNSDFHKIIIKSSQNPLIETTIRGVVELPLVFKAFFWYSQEQLERSNRHHKQLVEAMRARDPNEAERIMVEHINGARAVLLKMIRIDAVNGGTFKNETAVLTSTAGSC